MLASLAMLVRQGALRVAAGGSDWSALRGPIPSPALRTVALALPGRDGKAGSPIKSEGWICEVAARTEGDDPDRCPVAGRPAPALRVASLCLLVDRVAGD